MSGDFTSELSFSFSAGYLASCKILWHGTNAFTSPLKEVLLRIVISLKNPCHRLGMNPQTFGPVASATTTSLPRMATFP
jgi:hypothetical protein